jgi:hypothetical protein
MANIRIIVGVAPDGTDNLCLVMQSTDKDASDMLREFVERAMQLKKCAISVQQGEDGERWVGLVISEEDDSYLHN